MATFIDMRAQARRCRERKAYAEGVLAIADGLKNHAANWLFNDTSDFAGMLSTYAADAEKYYRKRAGKAILEEVEIWVKQVHRARLLIAEIPAEKRGGKVYPEMLDGLVGILEGMQESLQVYVKGLELYDQRLLDQAARLLRRSQHPKAASLLERVEADRKVADEKHRQALEYIWDREFGAARAAEVEAQALFSRPDERVAFEGVCGQAQEADERIREGRQWLDRHGEGRDDALDRAAEEVEKGLSILRQQAVMSELIGGIREDAEELHRQVQQQQTARRLERVKGLLEQGKFAGAVVLLRPVLEREERNPEGVELAGEIVAGGRRKAWELDGDGHPRKGLSLLEKMEQTLARIPALQTLVTELRGEREPLRQHVEVARRAWEEGTAFLGRRAFGKARAAFERAVRTDADLEEAHRSLRALPEQMLAWKEYRRGEAARKEKDFEGAFGSYVDALKGLPGDAEIRAARDRVAVQLGIRESFRLVGESVVCTVLIGDSFDIGRNFPGSRVNQITFLSDGISRTHGTVRRGGDGCWVLEDLQHGVTDANGKRGERHPLRHGDRLAIWPLERQPRAIVEIDVRTADEERGMSATLFCREAPTAKRRGQIEFSSGAVGVSVYALIGEKISFGGGAEALVQIEGAAPGEILWDEKCALVRDGGEGKVAVNGELVEGERPLRHGDRVALGGVELCVESLQT